MNRLLTFMNSINDRIAKCIIKYPDLKNPAIAKKLGVSRTKVWEVRKLTTEVKFSNKTKSTQPVITWDGFDGIIEKTIDEKTKVRRYRAVHAGGPIKGVRSKINPLLFGEPPYDEDIVNHWQPHMTLVVNDEITGKPLTAASITYKRNSQKSWYPQYYSNPMQSLDYQTFEAHTRSTIGGPLIRSFVTFLMGKKFGPELELINPGEDSEVNQKEIDANQDIIKALIQVENQFSFDENGYLDESFQDKIQALILNCFTFNRGAIIQRYDHSVSLNDRKFTGLPTSGIPAHPRELGLIETDPLTGRLKRVQWQNTSGMVDIDEIIYLWNPFVSANTHNSRYYGDSMLLPMIDALRVIRTNIGVNFRAMGTNAYSGLGLLFVKPDGSSESSRQTEYDEISNRIVPAATNVLMIDPQEVDYKDVNYNPQVDQFINMTESLIKYCAATLGIPHSQFYDESASNRATMIGKIDLTIATVMNPIRERLDRALSPQTYDKWFRQIYANNSSLLKKFRVKMVFEDLHFSEWYDRVDAANELESRKELTDKAYGDMLGMDNYTGKVKSDAVTNPGGNGGGQSLKFGDGSKLNLKEPKESLAANTDKKKA